jgi:hypothetical protein
MSEFSIDNIDYRVEKLDAFRQFALVRKLAPAFTLLAGQPDKEAARAGFPRAFAAISASLTNDDANDVLQICLGACMRRQGGNWARVSAPNGSLMFGDMNDISVVLQIVWHVVEESRLIDFFAEPRLI